MQPRFEGVHDPQRHADGQPRAPLGTVLLGHPTNLEGLTWRVPQPAALGHNGTFNAFRVLKQDVVGFEKYLDQAASDLLKHPQVDELLPPGAEAKIGQVMSIERRHGALREIVAANLCGRWRDGTPLALSADAPDPKVDRGEFRLRSRVRAAPTEPISAGAIREADRSCNGWRTTAGALSGAACPMDHAYDAAKPVTGASPNRNGACSATS